MCFWIIFSPAVVTALEGKDCRDVMKAVAESSTIPQDRLSHIIAGMYRVLSEAIRIPTSSLKQEVRWRQSPQLSCWNILTQNTKSWFGSWIIVSTFSCWNTRHAWCPNTTQHRARQVLSMSFIYMGRVIKLRKPKNMITHTKKLLSLRVLLMDTMTFSTEDISTCNRRKSTCVNSKMNDSCFSFRLPVSCLNSLYIC